MGREYNYSDKAKVEELQTVIGFMLERLKEKYRKHSDQYRQVLDVIELMEDIHPPTPR
jgi:2-C-methyl-D-erythritol 4-phosphate cytidylyltransferase